MTCKLFFIGILVVIAGMVNAQTCGYYYFQQGKKITTGIFNAKGKPDGQYVHTVQSVTKSSGTTTAKVQAVFTDKKGKEISSNTVNIKCKGNQLLIDMKGLIPPQQGASSGTTATAEAKGAYLEYPVSLKVGDQLKDGYFDMDMTLNGGMMGNVTVDITEREVVAKESVTTPAGTWEAYKITYKSKTVITMGIGIPIKMNMTEWFVPNFGVVKTEYKGGRMEVIAID